MKIHLLPIVSQLHKNDVVNDETKLLLKEVSSFGTIQFTMSDLPHFYDADLSLILIQSGGSESFFLEMENQLKEPYYLLTYGSNNSLAASMEILSYLKARGKKAEILHGTAEYIAKRLFELSDQKPIPPTKLGVIGKPSDWLIASNVDYNLCLSMFNVELIDIEIDELVDEFTKATIIEEQGKDSFRFDPYELEQAKKVSLALERLVEKYQLSGLTLRCFDLLGTIHTTGCLGLALLNSRNIVGTCEGDIPAMLSMHLLNQVTKQTGFMANPSRIDTEKNEIIFAHCTLPLNMATSLRLMTHFESGIGVGIRGEMKKEPITIFKLSNNLKDYYVSEGELLENLEEDNLCRTQVRIRLDDVSYFLKNPFGNHHIIVYGKHQKEIETFLTNIR